MSAEALVLIDIFLADPAVRAAMAVGTVAATLLSAMMLRRSPWRAAWTFLAVIGLTGVVATTLLGARGSVEYFEPARLRWCIAGLGGWPRGGEAVLNAILFVPVGFFGTLALRRPLFVALSLIVAAGAIELVQGSTGLGTCQVADAFRNTSGGIAAVVAAMVLTGATGWMRSGQRSGRRATGRNASPTAEDRVSETDLEQPP